MSNQNYIEEKDLDNASEPVSIDILKTIIEQTEKSICKIKCSKEGSGTGFFCVIPFPDKFNLLPVLITNNHVLQKKDISKGKIIKFSLNNEKQFFEISIDSSRKAYINEKYDITIIEIKKTDNLNVNDFLEIDENIYKDNLNDTYKQKSVYLIYYPYGKKASYSNGVIKSINEDNYNIEHLCPTKPGASGCPIINLYNNRVMGIHKGADIKNWNVGTFIKDPITKFYEENNKKKENKKNEFEKDKEPIEKFYEENNNKKENVEMDEKEKNKIYNEEKKENYDNEIQNKIDYCILTKDCPYYDLSFKVILLGDSGKIFIYFIYI